MQQYMGEQPSPVCSRHKLTMLTATAIAVADMVGIGVFTSLGFQVGGDATPFTVIMLWVIGGVAAMCGALCYAELAAAFPRSGGEYNLLSRIYHPVVGFVAGWISATVGFAAPIALAALAFGEYGRTLFPGASPILLANGVVWAVALVQLTGINGSARFQNISTILKIVLITGLIVAGLAFGEPQPISFAPSAGDVSYILSAAFAVNLVFVMYAYSGWNAATYIMSEVQEPERNVPRAMFAGTLIVLVLYVAFNAVILMTTPISALAGQIDVAQIAGRHVFGEIGGQAVAAVISIGLISAISAMIWLGSRVIETMGDDHKLLSAFSRTNTGGAPTRAIIFQCAVATLLLTTRSFETVLDYVQFSLTFCSFLVVLGLIVLRIRQPELVRPYRTWGYPITPLIFLGVTAFMMYHLLTERPVQSLLGLATMLAGAVVFYLAQFQLSQPASLGETDRV